MAEIFKMLAVGKEGENMAELCEVAVIGAGPYGLSIAAHLAARNIPHRIFGKAMETWATQMPKGMLLKSDGFATSLYDPARSFTFEHYCRERNMPYADLGIPPASRGFRRLWSCVPAPPRAAPRGGDGQKSGVRRQPLSVAA